MFEHLFQPVKIGKITLKSRLCMAPTQTFTSTADGFPTRLTLEQYETRCRGGWGLVAGEASYIREDGRPYHGFLGAATEEHFTKGLVKIADIMHKHGLPAAIQFVHGGRCCQKVVTGIQPVMASAPPPEGAVIDYPPDGSNKQRALTTEEVDEVIDAFVLAAVRAKKVGFDMVYFHGAHGFLFNNFEAHYLNHRTDKWGEPTAFNLEVIKRTRQAVGNDIALGLRMNGSDFFPGGITLEQNLERLPKYVAAGLDWIDVSAGARERLWWAMQPLYLPRGCIVHLAEAIKKVVNVPVITVGRINDPRLAENIIAQGKADIVYVCRPAIADPDFWIKTKEGRLDDIRRCMGCDLCTGKTILYTEPIKCAVNYEMGRTKAETEMKPAAVRKNILVVGGGVAGMEFARVANLRGHNVTLYDKDDKLGGAIASMASRIPHLNTHDLMNSVTYLVTQLKKQNVKVVLGKEITPDFIVEQKPDAVVLATGSLPSVPSIPGVKGNNVIMLDDYLKNRPEVGKRVVVLGGGNGWETAVSLAREGKKTTLVEESAEPGNTAYITRQRKPLLMYLSREARLEILTNTRTHEINEYGVVVTDAKGNARLIPADTVLIAWNRLPNNALRKALEGKVKEVYSIGDCVEPGSTMQAIPGASRLARDV